MPDLIRERKVTPLNRSRVHKLAPALLATLSVVSTAPAEQAEGSLSPFAPNDYRVAGPFVDLNFGLIELDWEASPIPLITFRIIDVEGGIQLEHKVELGELRADREVGGG